MDEQPHPNRREWLGKAALEATLIVFGLALAYGINEWHDARTRDQRVQDVLASIRVELQSNLEAVAKLIAFNEQLIPTLYESAKTGKPYMRGIVPGLDLNATAWDASKSAGIAPDIPLATLMTLGRAYTDQERFLREIEFFLNQGYTTDVLERLRKQPDTLAGILHDYTLHAKGMKKRYEDALALLR